VNLKSLARERFVLVARESSPSLFGKILALCSEAGFAPQIVSTGVVWASVVLLVEAIYSTARRRIWRSVC